MRISHVSFEGSAEEFRAVSHLFGQPAAPVSASPSTQIPRGDEFPVELVERVITRSALAPNHRAMLTAVVDSGDEGILIGDIAAGLGMTPEQFRGVSGSFGGRVSKTPGWPTGVFYFDYEYDEEAKDWRYWLDEPYRSAVAGKLKI